MKLTGGYFFADFNSDLKSSVQIISQTNFNFRCHCAYPHRFMFADIKACCLQANGLDWSVATDNFKRLNTTEANILTCPNRVAPGREGIKLS